MISFIIAFLLLTPSVSLAETPFTDVETDFWADDEIRFLHEREVIGGYETGEFKPNKPVTRAQAAIIIVHALELDVENRPAPSFRDIRDGFHAYEYVAAVADEGIIHGRNGNFLPNAPLTRGQMAAIIDRAFHLEEATTQTSFTDVKRNNTFYSSIQNLAHHRISTGYEVDITFRPNQPTTRAQFSVFLSRVLEDDFKPNVPAIPELAFFEELILEAESEVEMAMYEKWEDAFYHDQPLSFEEVKPTFENYYTDEMIDSVWKPFYKEELMSWGPALAQTFHFQMMEDLTLHVVGQNYVVITGIEPVNEMNSGEMYFEYSLVRTDSNWLIDDISGNY